MQLRVADMETASDDSFDVDSAPDSEPQPDSDWLAFEAERRALANGYGDVPF